MSPPPRSVAATTTTPPPPSSALARIASALTHWKTILAVVISIVVFLVGLGAAAVRYDAGMARKADLAAEHSFAAGIGEKLQKLGERVSKQEEGARWRDAALKGIADKLGVFVPPPPSEPGP